VDSILTVWWEMHEDYLQTLGRAHDPTSCEISTVLSIGV
jgi:hypothetical protein